MPRKYDSSRRVQAAQKTRDAIAEVAFRLHGEGILDVETLAREADVSVATVRKHFPTREHLFEGCTAFGMHTVPMPDLTRLAAIADPEARTRQAVAETQMMNESVIGQMWSAFKLEDESPVMAATLQQMDSLNEAIAGLIVDAWGVPEARFNELRGVAVALLSPLTYRAMRRYGGLSLEQAYELCINAFLATFRPQQGKEPAIADS
jgi:AcrR family transcriptional regulator